MATVPPPYPGRIIITWPAPTKSPAQHPLFTWPIEIHDYDTGEQILTATGLRMVLGGEQWDNEAICVDLTELVDEEGRLLRGDCVRAVPAPDDSGRVRTGVFRYYVVEMRIRDNSAADVQEQA